METFIFQLAFICLIAWLGWRFFGKRIRDSRARKWTSAKLDAHRIPDEAYYDMAGEELKRGSMRQGLWLKALAEAKGDETRARASYLKLRVAAMRSEAADALYASASQTPNASPAQKKIITCPKCHGRLRVDVDKHLEVTCAHCSNVFEVST